MQPRRIAVSLDRKTLLVTSGRIKSLKGLIRTASSARVIPLDQIDRVQRGCVTKRLLHAPIDKTQKRQALSIVYFDSGSLDTLDLIVPSRREFEIVVQTLEDLAALASIERRRLSILDQVAQFHFAQNNIKILESNISYSHWMALTDRLHTPLSKSRLTEIFRGFSDKVALADVSSLLWQVYEESNVDTTVSQLWDEMFHNDPVKEKGAISAVAFLAFLRKHQKCSNYQLEEACDLIRSLHSGQQDRLSRAQFLQYLTCDANDLVDPERAKEGSQDMHQPLSRYWIHTAQSTFGSTATPVKFGRKSSKNPAILADEQMYTSALMRGVRCLELVVWDGLDPGTVVVSARNPAKSPTSSSIPLHMVLVTVANFLEQYPYSFPIILHIQNHCRRQQEVLAEQMETILGPHLLGPAKGIDESVILPSPERARGKVIVCSKRLASGSTIVIMDDFDEDIEHETIASKCSELSHDKGSFNHKNGRVVGFDAHGPLYSVDPAASSKTPGQLLKQATLDAREATEALEKARKHERELQEHALSQENLAAQLTLRAGLLPHQVKQKANIEFQQQKSSGIAGDNQLSFFHSQEEKASKEEEGVEIHEILPHLVNGGKSRYENAAQEAMDAQRQVIAYQEKLALAERDLENTIISTQSEKGQEEDIREQARKAMNEARMHSEDAIAAAQRVEKLKELVAQVQDKAGSAGTVVQTALTEAKISEKRAFDAEARAERARVAAEKDRKRAEEETNKEELLERVVSDLHQDCQVAQNKYDQVRERIEKATLRLERAKEQIRSLENSSKYREQLLLQEKEPRPLVLQHGQKVEERDNCLALIDKATKESISVDRERKQAQLRLEEKAQEWRIQAELASQTRRNADRSAHVADELLEHAIEEREAAQLRHVARERAEATVSDRGSQKESLFAQLAEAERASAEAAKLAVQSKHRAATLANEVQKAGECSGAQQLVDEKKWIVLQARGELDSAILLKRQKDQAMEKEKQRLDTDSDLMKGVMVGAHSGGRIQVEPSYEQEAIDAYKASVKLRAEANEASRETQIFMNEANVKHDIAKRARDYKIFMDTTAEIPEKLSQMTLLHSCRLKNWTDSLELSSVHFHSMSQKLLVKQLARNPEEAIQLHSFTKNHLCRIFASDKKFMSFPMKGWSLGCQCVGVNLTFPDEHVLVADGRFRENGSCGYVLKPRSLTHNDVRDEETPQRWALQVIGGFNIPSDTSNVNLRVQVKVWSAVGDPIVYETGEASRNCFNPSWGNVFDLKILDPSIAIVNFIVYNGSEFVAGASLPVSCWREGFRSVALFNADHSRSGPFEFASLLVQATRHR